MYEEFTPEYLKQQILDHTNTEICTIEGSFAHDMASGVAYNMSLLYEELAILYDMIFFRSLYGEYLDEKCSEFGITRTPGTKACGTITVTAAYNTSVPSGTLFSCDNMIFISDTDTEVTADGSAQIAVTAENAGSAYNMNQTVGVLSVLPLPGISSLAASGFTGGKDEESDTELKERLFAYIKAAGSGCVNDYIKWASEVPGVGSVRVVSTWNGAGTVKVIITDAEYTRAENALVSQVAAHIEKYRPIGAVVTVVPAESVEINIRAELTLDDNTSAEDVQGKAEEALVEYLKEVARDGTEVRLSRVCGCIMQIKGIIDCKKLKINGYARNLDIEDGSVPYLSEVTISEHSV